MAERIEIIIDQRRGDQSGVEAVGQLRAALASLDAQARQLNISTFDAFSRAQVAPRITAINELRATTAGVLAETTKLAQTLVPVTGLNTVVNQVLGLDQRLKSAAASAQTLRQSLAAAADADRILRELAPARYQVAESADRLALIKANQVIGSPEDLQRAIRAAKDQAETGASQVRDAWSRGFIPDSVYKQTESTLAKVRQEVDRTATIIQTRQERAVKETAVRTAEIFQSDPTLKRSPFEVTGASETQTEIRPVVSGFDRYQMQQTINRTIAQEQARTGTGGFLSRLNRQGVLEGQAAIINSVQALASGMNPLHVAIMESSQLAGAAVQGGLLPLSRIIGFIGSTAGLAIVGVVGFAAAIGKAAYEAYQAESTLRRLHDVMLLQGRPGATVVSNAEVMQRQIMSASGLGRPEALAGAAAIQQIPNISPQARESLREVFPAAVRTQFEGDADKAAQSLDRIFTSASGMKAFVEANNLLTGSLKDEFDALIAVGDTFGASELAARGYAETLKGVSQALRESREAAGSGLLGWMRTHDIFSRPQEPNQTAMDADLRQRLGTGFGRQITFPEGRQGPTPVEVQADRAVEQRLQTEQQITGLIRQRGQVLVAQEVTATQASKERYANTRAEIDRQLAESHTPIQQEQQSVLVAQLEKEITLAEQAAEKDISQRQRVATLRQQLAEATAAYEQGALAKVEGAVHRTTAAEIQAFQRVADERRRIAREALERRLFEVDYQAAQAPADPRVQLIAAQQKLNQLEKDSTGNHKEIEELQKSIVSLTIQVANYARETAQAVLQQREVIAQAKDDLATVVSLKRQELAITEQAVRLGQAPASAGVQAQTALIQSQIAAQQKYIDLRMQMVQADNQFAQGRLQTQTAMLGLGVAQFDIPQSQALQQEQRLTAQVMAEEQRRVSSLLQIQNLRPEQVAQINNQLADLYQQDAQKQITLQAQITQSIRAENERRTQYFKNFFQDVEKGASDLLIAGLNKTQTRTQALQNLGRNLVSSFVSNAADMASNWAGKSLATTLGVKIDPDKNTSISEVLSKALGNALGLTKDEPKLDAAAVQQKVQAAAEAHQKAASALMDSAQALKAAAEAGPYKGGQNPDVSPTTLPPSQTRFRPAPAVSTDIGAAGEYGVGQRPSSDLEASRRAIRKIESGSEEGDYSALGPVTKTGDRGYGAYQVMGANVPSWSQQYYGQRLTPEQFRSNREAQDAVFNGQFGKYTEKYGPEGAARAWFAGEGGMNNLSARDVTGSTVGSYSSKFINLAGASTNSPADMQQPARSPFPPWIKFNSRGEPYDLSDAPGQQISAAQVTPDRMRDLAQSNTRAGAAGEYGVDRAGYGSISRQLTDPIELTTGLWAIPPGSIVEPNTIFSQLTGQASDIGTKIGETARDSFSKLWTGDIRGALGQSSLEEDAVRAKQQWESFSSAYQRGAGIGELIDIQKTSPFAGGFQPRTLGMGMSAPGGVLGEAFRAVPGTLRDRTGAVGLPTAEEWAAMRGSVQREITETQNLSQLKEPIKLNLQLEPLKLEPFVESVIKTETAIKSKLMPALTDVQTATQTINQAATQTATLTSGLTTPGAKVDLGVDLSSLTVPTSQTATATVQTAQAAQATVEAIRELPQRMSTGGAPPQPPDVGGVGSYAMGSLPGPRWTAGPHYYTPDGRLHDYIPTAAESSDPTVTTGYQFAAAVKAGTGREVSAEEGPQAWRAMMAEGDRTAAAMKEAATALGGIAKSGTGMGSSRTGIEAGASRGLSLLTQGLGIAASAAAIFGRQLSPTARAIIGTVGVLSQLSSFVKSAGSVFDIFGTTTKTVSTATSLLGTANTANTLATTINTTATYANSTAQSAGGAGSALGGIGSVFKMIPFIGGLFSQGGIVPSAAGGMVVAGQGALGGGGQLSILHPREMVLPAHLSDGIQQAIANGNTAPSGNSATVNDSRVFNYSPNVSGYHPYRSRSEIESLLRQHGGAFENFVRDRLGRAA